MIKLTLKQLTAIRELARVQNFTQAAAKLHTTQSNLSIAVQEAEQLLGARLFDRTTKRCQLTPVGEEFLPVVERVLADLQRGVEHVQASVALHHGTLAIGTSSLLASGLVAELLGEFHARHPGIALRIEDGATAEHIRMLRDGAVELAIGTYSEQETDFEQFPLFRVPLVVLSHPSLGWGDTVSWHQLEDARLVSIVRQSSVGQLIEKTYLEVLGRPYRPMTECHHWASVLPLAAALRLACIAPRHALPDQHGLPLVCSALTGPVVHRTISVAHAKSRRLSLPARAFVAQLKEDARFAASRAAGAGAF